MTLEETMQTVFDQHTRADRVGHVRGGDGKLSCVQGLRFSRGVIRSLVKTPCCEIIKKMWSLFSDLYLYTEAGDISLQAQSMNEEDREQDPRVNHAREMLRTSNAFLSTIEKYLKFDWDIDDDVLRFTSFLTFLPADHDTLDDYGTALTHGILPGIPF